MTRGALDGATAASETMPSSLDGLRIATAPNLVDTELDKAVAGTFDNAIATLERLGAEVVEIDLPNATEMLEAFVPLQMAEAHHVHRELLGLFPAQADAYGSDVRGRLERAASVSVADYLTAVEQRRRIVASFDRRLERVDAVISPISAVGPSRIDSSDSAVVNGRPRPFREAVMRFTVPQNLTGLPSATVCAGFDDDRLPVGIQLTAARWREKTAVAVAGALQAALGPITIAPEFDPADRR